MSSNHLTVCWMNPSASGVGAGLVSTTEGLFSFGAGCSLATAGFFSWTTAGFCSLTAGFSGSAGFGAAFCSETVGM